MRWFKLLAVAGLVVGVGSVAYLDTIASGAQAIKRCRNQPDLQDDLAFVQSVRLARTTPAQQAITNVPGCYAGTSSADRWCVRPDEQLAWLGVKSVTFRSADEYGAECRVLRCGVVLGKCLRTGRPSAG